MKENKNKMMKYLNEVQIMLDIIENIKDKDLVERVILQFYKCEKILIDNLKNE